MNFQNRKLQILDVLQKMGAAEVADLAKLLACSEMTVRRDLAILASQGLLSRTHGGAMRNELALTPVRFEHKIASNSEQKQQIAQLAAQEILDGETIFLDCGSTVFHMCPFIRHRSINVITNSLPIVIELMDSEPRVNFIGGELDFERRAVHGVMAQQHICQYRAHRAFLGVSGLSAEHGLSANSEMEAQISLLMAGQANKSYLLCDASKIGTAAYFVFAPVTLVDCIITNSSVQPHHLMALEQHGLDVLQAGKVAVA